MRIDYPDNSFMLSWQHCQAWYNADGSLKDCEYKRWRKGNLITLNVSKKHVHVLAWLEKQGKREADLLQRGIVKRKLQQ